MYKEIRRKIYSYTRLTNKAPGRLLVGRMTGCEIKMECENYLVLKPCKTGIRYEIFGLPIYVMDEEKYLEVAP